MRLVIVPIMAIGLGLLAGCETKVDTPRATDSTTAIGETYRIDEIAGDKTMTADLMRRAHEKGTFDDAMAIALQDSMLAADVMAAIKADPRLAAMLTSPKPMTAVSSTTTKSTSTGSTRTSQRAASTSRQSGDVLDKTERTVQKANEKIDQAARVKRQAEEAGKKIEGILKPR